MLVYDAKKINLIKIIFLIVFIVSVLFLIFQPVFLSFFIKVFVLINITFLFVCLIKYRVKYCSKQNKTVADMIIALILMDGLIIIIKHFPIPFGLFNITSDNLLLYMPIPVFLFLSINGLNLKYFNNKVKDNFNPKNNFTFFKILFFELFISACLIIIFAIISLIFDLTKNTFVLKPESFLLYFSLNILWIILYLIPLYSFLIFLLSYKPDPAEENEIESLSKSNIS